MQRLLQFAGQSINTFVSQSQLQCLKSAPTTYAFFSTRIGRKRAAEKAQKEAQRLAQPNIIPKSRKRNRNRQVANEKPMYNIFQALRLVRAHQIRPFDETIDICFRLGIDTKHGDQMVRGSCPMPGGLGKSKIVAALAEENLNEQLKQAGANIIGEQDIIKKLKEQQIDFDILYATNEMMVLLKPYARLLGPKGLMPNTKLGTLVSKNQIVQSVTEAKKGSITFRAEKGSNLHAPLGSSSFEDKRILLNMKQLTQTLAEKKPAAARGTYFKHVYLKSSMGPSFEIDPIYVDPVSKKYMLNQID